ncbi:MAG: hypothetical protein LHW56_06965 [Candidatus Cloacimonetes bacterium]|nr:hypothetical protein [Candidatus Cloacimonadota bacterium]MDY0172633.1 hypothetical protein [Candidatus Cloacimonadaceae bacterium]
MGTSTNYSGSPNWGPVKSETTRVGGEGYVTEHQAGSIVSGFIDQMLRAPQLGFGTPLSRQGGGSSGSGSGGGIGGSDRGGARRIGRSARTVARRIGGFLADVRTKGFREALAGLGLTDLTGKSPDEIALALADLLGGPASLIEEAALRGALMELVLEWSEGVLGIDGLVESVTNAAQNIEGALHDFFGHYIFEVFKIVGYQGVLAAHGFEKAESMASQIRDFIDAKIEGLESLYPLSSVDWNGVEGAAIVDSIVADTIAIFGEDQE